MDRFIRERSSMLFAALANPTRLRIVELLLNGEKNVNDIASSLDIQQSSASQHLAVLTRAGVLVVEPRGTMRCYRVRGPRIAKILGLIEEFCSVHSLYGFEDADSVDSANAADPARQSTERKPVAATRHR